VDEYNRPLYGDVFGLSSQQAEQAWEEVDKKLWGELLTDEEGRPCLWSISFLNKLTGRCFKRIGRRGGRGGGRGRSRGCSSSGCDGAPNSFWSRNSFRFRFCHVDGPWGLGDTRFLGTAEATRSHCGHGGGRRTAETAVSSCSGARGADPGFPWKRACLRCQRHWHSCAAGTRAWRRGAGDQGMS
jgi:hypothetical protein